MVKGEILGEEHTHFGQCLRQKRKSREGDGNTHKYVNVLLMREALVTHEKHRSFRCPVMYSLFSVYM